MIISKELWDRYEASNAKSRKKSSALKAVSTYVNTIRYERAARKGGDVLGRITPQQKLAWARQNRRHDADKAREQAIRETLLTAAREARRIGFTVRASKNSTGLVSSYYASRGNGRPIRISDHYLPDTAKRAANTEFHGGSPFAAEIIIDAPMTATRLRRLIVLAEAGRI
jgi:hypothetical protein